MALRQVRCDDLSLEPKHTPGFWEQIEFVLNRNCDENIVRLSDLLFLLLLL